MSIHLRAQLFLIRPQSLKLSGRAISTTKTLQSRSRSLALHLPARSLPQKAHVVVAGVVTSASMLLLHKDSAWCQPADGPSDSGDGKKRKKADDSVDKKIDAVLGNCGELTLAGSLGFCSGYALKLVGKAAALAVGLVFIVGQVAAYNGYIDIKWGKLQKDAIDRVDPNGDGKIDGVDLKLWYRRLLAIMKTKLPSSVGFSSGFALGIYCS
ncbi:unnamed protein product [Hyaloperonospora brassicae]|uniref:EF-hand domain-containing protein n=1 Tax=Hyaloperonospora brassicae TaxID=162125 RepID=A0AAV0U7T3_HYABA|nr:unnamed protein product [Hyaloperonospora brassicae]